MRVAVVVHGRFHAFDLVRALLKRGNDVTVFTNYPRWAVARFGISPAHVQSFPLHGILSRAAGWCAGKTGWFPEASLHRMFGRWAASRLRKEQWDVIHAWSGIAEEIYSDPALHGSLKLIMRGSAHIRTQSVLLVEEQRRVQCAVDQPSPWMIAREEREYALTDWIVVLSTFAYKSFREQGVPESKIQILSLGTDTTAFRPDSSVINARRERILSGAPLRILFVGGVSWQKGLFDFRELIDSASGRFKFRFVGPVPAEATAAVAAMQTKAEFMGKRPHHQLPSEYAWGDIFVFPTIQDGYAVVLAQASAAALPILTTPNCCGPDLITEGRTGWLLPIRNSQAFLRQLDWCDLHREDLAEMVTAGHQEFRTRDWADVAADFEKLCAQKVFDSARPVMSPDV